MAIKNTLKHIAYTILVLTLLYTLYNICCKSVDDLTPESLIKNDGYVVETHTVTTEDGYILKIHRIPGPPNSIPVYIQHGFISSSIDWLKNGRNQSLPYILSDHGYDVWLGNVRGNAYSKYHKSLSTSDPKFWNFSWHEQGIYDVTAVITYITKLTDNALFYIGHSMGVSIFSVAASERPEILKNVRAAIAVAPAPYERHIQQGFVKFVSRYWRGLQKFFDCFGIHEILQQNVVFDFVSNRVCTAPVVGKSICSNLLFWLMGYNSKQLNYDRLPLYFSKIPAGTSVMTFIHWLQHMEVNEFQKFDYGREMNLKIYKSAKPAKYDLTKIRVPVAVFLSDNDIVTVSQDVRHYYEQLPIKLGLYDVGHSFSHSDFLWGINATELVYNKIIDIFSDVTTKSKSAS